MIRAEKSGSDAQRYLTHTRRTRLRRVSRLGISSAALLLAPEAVAQGERQSSSAELAQAAERLSAGQWVWAPEIAPDGPVLVYVDLSRQLAEVYRNGVRIGVTTVSTGKPGHATPSGVFTILQKDRNHHSSTYNNAPMPFQERLTWDGVALHAGGLPGYPESHGCVHLPYAFAEALFGITSLGGTVVIQGQAGVPVRMPLAGVLAPVMEGGGAADHTPLPATAEWRWQPEAAPDGPVSILLSTRDQRLIVLRNGVEIGRARAEVPGPQTGTFLALLTAGEDRALHWTLLPLPGHSSATGLPVDATAMQRLRLPAAFLAALRPLLTHGVHVLVTPEPLIGTSTSTSLTVIAANK